MVRGVRPGAISVQPFDMVVFTFWLSSVGKPGCKEELSFVVQLEVGAGP